MVRPLALLALVAIAAFATVSATAQPWSDDFDSYALGSGLHGQGGWKGFDNDPTYDAYVTDVVSNSPPHSVGIGPGNDPVHEFSGANSGTWVVVAWHYRPAGGVGEQELVLFNIYNDGGPYNWSTIVAMDATSVASWNFLDPFPEATMPVILDQWVEIRVEIDLDTDHQRIFYGGSLLIEKNWSDGGEPGNPGALDIACIELYHYPPAGEAMSYFDDVSLMHGPTPVEPSSWGTIKAAFR
jgi:hypothetical protein